MELKTKPSKKEKPDTTFQTVKKKLLVEIQKIGEASKLELQKQVNGEYYRQEDVKDDADMGANDISDDVAIIVLGTKKESLRRIEEAVRKIDAGTYGICEECGEPIPASRLLVMPFAIYCVECQTVVENTVFVEEFE